MMSRTIKIYTIVFSILTNQIICDLMREGNEDAKNTEKIDTFTKPLYEKYPRNILEGPSMQELQSSFSPSHRSLEPPLILSSGLEHYEGLNYDRENALFFRHPSDFPEYRVQSQNHRYRPISHVPHYSFDNGGHKEIIPSVEPSYSMGIGFESFGNLRFPMHFLMIQRPEIRYTGPVLSSEMKNHYIELPSNSPHIEILKSIGYALPPDITIYHPTTYAKDYLIDVPSPSTTKPQNHDTQSLLLGELESNNDDEEQNEKQTVESYGMDNTNGENENPGFGTDRPSQYYYSNTNPITFEQRMRRPNNIYEIISAEKIVPKEMEMTVHIGRYQRPYTTWKPIIAARNVAEGSEAIEVNSSPHENVTVERNESFRKNSANGQVRSDLEILLTGEAVKRDEDDVENPPDTEKYGNGTESNVVVSIGEEIEMGGDLKTETQISVVSISESANTTNNIIDC